MENVRSSKNVTGSYVIFQDLFGQRKQKCRGTHGNSGEGNKMKQNVEKRMETRTKKRKCRGTQGNADKRNKMQRNARKRGKRKQNARKLGKRTQNEIK
jgi:hypothetical protein